MRLLTVTIFAVTGRLLSLVIAKPVPNRKADGGGIAIPLTRHSPLLKSNDSIDLDAISSHGISVKEKMLRGLDNYEMNTGTMHPFSVKPSESGLERRGASVPLTFGRHDMWIAEISIGTPPQTLKVQIDTGTADMWVLQTGCSGITGGDRNLWDPDSSKSAKTQGQPFQRKYADGTVVKGGVYTDNVTIAGFTADPQTFGSATSYTSRIQNHGDVDGLLGLAFPSMSKFGADPLLVSLISQKKLIDPRFSLKFSSSGAEMYFGGANSMLYNGDITHTRVTIPGLWQVSMDDVRVNGKKILNNVPVIFDTGSSYIYGEWNQVAELYGRLGGTLVEHAGSGYYYLPCDSFPALGLTFSGRTFELSPDHFRLIPIEEGGSPYCFGAIIAQSKYTGSWIIGTSFLQGVYSVFDYSTFQVGFAKLA